LKFVDVMVMMMMMMNRAHNNTTNMQYEKNHKIHRDKHKSI